MLVMVIKLDISKDYDKLNWFYLRLIFLHVGFNLIVVNWNMGYVNSMNFDILVNGVASVIFPTI